MDDPVVQVIDQANDEIVYTVRIKGRSFQPKVFKGGTYTVKVMDPDKGTERVFRDLKARR